MKRWVLLGVLLACGPKAEPVAPPTDPAALERKNKAIPYRNQAIDAMNKGDWAAARTALQQCVEELNDSDCISELKDLESQHRF
jgi:hypothetical protein